MPDVSATFVAAVLRLLNRQYGTAAAEVFNSIAGPLGEVEHAYMLAAARWREAHPPKKPAPSEVCIGHGGTASGPPCCDRAGQHHGGGGGEYPRDFRCPKACTCHD